MKKPLRDLVNERFEQEALNDVQMEKLLAIARLPAPKPPKKIPRWSIAALVAMVMLSLLPRYFGVWPHQPVTPRDIAEEVAMNHIKMKPLEIETQSMARIERYLAELDFSPINSRQFSLGQDQLLGGRYCSIQGITAAQLRYADNEGRKITLYETPYYPDRLPPLPHIEKGENPIMIYVSGLEITLWVEKGLLMASVAPENFNQ